MIGIALFLLLFAVLFFGMLILTAGEIKKLLTEIFDIE
jgi:hypothetical protein